MTELEANVFDHEGEVIEAYFYADTDVQYVLDSSIERAEEEGIDDYYEIVVTPFDPSDEDFQDPLGRWCPNSGVYEVKEQEEDDEE